MAISCANCARLPLHGNTLHCPHCGEDVRFECEVCGIKYKSIEPSYAAWEQTPEGPSMCGLCDHCAETLPKHPEEGWPLTPLNIFA